MATKAEFEEAERREAERRARQDAVRATYTALAIYPIYNDNDVLDGSCSVVWREGIARDLLLEQLRPDVAPYSTVMPMDELLETLRTIRDLFEDEKSDEGAYVGNTCAWLANTRRPLVAFQREPADVAGTGMANIENDPRLEPR